MGVSLTAEPVPSAEPMKAVKQQHEHNVSDQMFLYVSARVSLCFLMIQKSNFAVW